MDKAFVIVTQRSSFNLLMYFVAIVIMVSGQSYMFAGWINK